MLTRDKLTLQNFRAAGFSKDDFKTAKDDLRDLDHQRMTLTAQRGKIVTRLISRASVISTIQQGDRVCISAQPV